MILFKGYMNWMESMHDVLVLHQALQLGITRGVEDKTP